MNYTQEKWSKVRQRSKIGESWSPSVITVNVLPTFVWLCYVGTGHMCSRKWHVYGRNQTMCSKCWEYEIHETLNQYFCPQWTNTEGSKPALYKLAFDDIIYGILNMLVTSLSYASHSIKCVRSRKWQHSLGIVWMLFLAIPFLCELPRSSGQMFPTSRSIVTICDTIRDIFCIQHTFLKLYYSSSS